MSSSNNREFIITINGDYNYINDFIVWDINNDNIVTR
jgi:hypothetical protein